jgi:hypothetical protein
MAFVKKFAPLRFDCFDFVPSIGALGGLLTLWSGSTFRGTVVEKELHYLTVDFLSLHNGNRWTLTNIYGPGVEPDKSILIDGSRTVTSVTPSTGSFLGISIFVVR